MNRGAYPVLQLPSVAFDFAKLHWLSDDPLRPDPETPRYYEVKAQIAAYIKPRRVVEIGVRAGYSALAFYQGHPYEEFYGLDMDVGEWGGVAGYLDEALLRLGDFTDAQCGGSSIDTQTVKVLSEACQWADLFHVDGNHTPMGAAHDIMLALNSNARHIVVDDYDYTEHVADGADWAVQTFGLPAYYVGDGGYRGNLVIIGPVDGPACLKAGLAKAQTRTRPEPTPQEIADEQKRQFLEAVKGM